MRRTYSKPFWLIARYGTGGMEALRTNLVAGKEALPVFSFEDEAKMFLELEAFGGEWRPRKTAAGELISILYCLCVGVDRVVMDPLPAPFAGSNDLLSMGREAFMDFACEKGRGARRWFQSSRLIEQAGGRANARLMGAHQTPPREPQRL